MVGSGLRSVGCKRLVAAATVAVAVALGGVASSAHADAYGCSSYGNGTAGKYPYAKGYYCADIKGSGTYVNTVAGGFRSVGNVCNWTVTAEFFDRNGRWYKTYESPMRRGCMRSGDAGIGIQRKMSVGRMCSTLRSSGVRIQSVCHSIY